MKINWSPYEDLTLEEKIAITKNAIKLHSNYSGNISARMVQQHQRLLAALEREKSKQSPRQC